MSRKKAAKDETGAATAPVVHTNSQAIIKDVAASFGAELVRALSNNREKPKKIEGISWGPPSLNAICTGSPFVGVPFGRIVEIYGPESSGKTTACLHLTVQAQRAKIPVGYIDSEHALHLGYARGLGVNTEELIFSQPDYGEQAVDIGIALMKSGVRLLIFDSVAALTPLAMIDGTMEKKSMGEHARLMGQAMKKIVGVAGRTGCACVFINQTREKIGVMFGSPETTTGGNALKFAASLRLRISASQSSKKKIQSEHNTLMGKKEKETLGTLVSFDCRKNKIANPFLNTEIPIYFGSGLDITGDHYEYAAAMGWIQNAKGGYKLSAGDEKKGKKDKGVSIVAYDKLEENLPLLIEIMKRESSR